MLDSLYYFPLFVGIPFMIAGVIMLKYPPKKINYFYGYRTKSSMKSQERWDFAQNYSAKELINLGFFLCLTSLIGKFIDMDETTQIWVGIAFSVFTIVVLFFRVETAIKDKFND